MKPNTKKKAPKKIFFQTNTNKTGFQHIEAVCFPNDRQDFPFEPF
jgi:hypothetical protein